MNCKKCGHELELNSWYCTFCGAENSKICKCGSKNHIEEDYCAFCGRSFKEEDGEQRKIYPGTYQRESNVNQEKQSPYHSPYSNSFNQRYVSTPTYKPDFGNPLRAILISNGIILFIYLIIHLNLKDTDMDMDELIPVMQWLRFSTVLFAFFDLTAIIFDSDSSKKMRLFTLLTVAVFFVISWFFLFPAVSDEYLLKYLF